MNGLQIFAVVGWGLAGLFAMNWRIEKDRTTRTRKLNALMAKRILEMGGNRVTLDDE